jgi:hypothetical protein
MLEPNFMPPRCERHGEQMVLFLTVTPYRPVGYGSISDSRWSCRSCTKEQEQLMNQQTRWPNAGEPGGAEL